MYGQVCLFTYVILMDFALGQQGDWASRSAKNAEIIYHPMSFNHSFVMLYAATDPVRPQYKYVGAKYAKPGKAFDDREMVFSDAPVAAYYQVSI